MAFCKNCGKEIPEGGVCDCTNNAPADNGANPFGGNQNDVMNGGFDDVAKKAKNNLPMIVAAAVAVVVLAIVLVFIGGHTGAKGAANKYAKSITQKKGGKSFYAVTLPKDAIKQLKDDDDYKDLINDYNDEMEDDLEDYKYKIKSVKKGKKLKKKALKGAEAYFESVLKSYDADDDEVKVKKGYEFKIRLKVTEKEDKETKSDSQKICVVKIKGDGWKVIPVDADTLESRAKD